MDSRAASMRQRPRPGLVLQVLMVAACWGAGEALVRWTHAPLPGSIAGLLVLLALLGLRVVHPPDVERGAGFLLARMMLFFTPAVVAVVDHPEWMGALGVRLAVAIVAGTLAVMLVTGSVVELCVRGLDARGGGGGGIR